MKKIYTLGLAALAALAFFNANAQIYTPTGLTEQTAGGSGNGVGTDTPGAKLHVKGVSSPILFLEPEARADANGGWDYPETMLDIHGLSGTQGTGVPPNFTTAFRVGVNGNTQIGEFPSAPPNKLSVRSSVGVYASTTTWMRMLFSGGSAGSVPELNWRASGDNHFRIKNDQTDVTGLTLAKDGEVGIGTHAFAGSHSLFVAGTAAIDEMFVQKPSKWGEEDEYIKLRYNTQPQLRWESTEGKNFWFYSNDNIVMQLSPEGKVGIGTDNFVGNHSLYVAGSMIMEEGFVKIQGNWPDYVFAPDYALMPLSEVGEYIKHNGRLPGMPGAAQVAEEGIAVGETQRLLTEKVEELTLYLLRMTEEMEALREEITTLKGEK